MLTFDNMRVAPEPTLADCASGTIPDVIEVGENDEYFIRVRRASRMVEFYSKRTGIITAAQADMVLRDATSIHAYGMSPRQAACARDAFALGART